MHEKNCCCLVTKSCPTLCDPMDCGPTSLLCPWDSLGKNTGVRCHFLLQGIFPTQGSNPHLLHCRWIFYLLVKNMPAMWETRVRSLGGKDPLKKGIATHSSILTWRSPRTIWCMGSQRVGHNWVTFTFTLYHLSHQGSLCFYGQCELWRGDFDCVSSAVATALSSGIVSIWRTCSGLQYPDRLSDLGSFFGSFGSQSPHQ